MTERQSDKDERAEKDEAYHQRNILALALTRLYPSGIRRTNIEGWSEDWHGCCYIDLPSGQISYHYHDSQAHQFSHLPPYMKEWDGHDKDEVEYRLLTIPATAPESGTWNEALEEAKKVCRDLREKWPLNFGTTTWPQAFLIAEEAINALKKAAPQVPDAVRHGDDHSARRSSGGTLESSITPAVAAPEAGKEP